MEIDYLARKYQYLSEEETGTLIDEARKIGLEWVFVENISSRNVQRDLWKEVNNAMVSWLSDRFNIPIESLYSRNVTNLDLPLPKTMRRCPNGNREYVPPSEIISGISVVGDQINFPLSFPDLAGEDIVQRGFISAYAIEQEHYERKPFYFKSRPAVVEITNGHRTTEFDNAESDGCTTGLLTSRATRQYVAKFPPVKIDDILESGDINRYSFSSSIDVEARILLKKIEEQQAALIEKIKR